MQKVARIRCYTMLSTIFKCQDLQQEISGYIKNKIDYEGSIMSKSIGNQMVVSSSCRQEKDHTVKRGNTTLLLFMRHDCAQIHNNKT